MILHMHELMTIYHQIADSIFNIIASALKRPILLFYEKDGLISTKFQHRYRARPFITKTLQGRQEMQS